MLQMPDSQNNQNKHTKFEVWRIKGKNHALTHGCSTTPSRPPVRCSQFLGTSWVEGSFFFDVPSFSGLWSKVRRCRCSVGIPGSKAHTSSLLPVPSLFALRTPLVEGSFFFGRRFIPIAATSYWVSASVEGSSLSLPPVIISGWRWLRELGDVEADLGETGGIYLHYVQ